ncbi:hypothetical protein WJR50_31210 [Catalinimonas sp. 4WD22]|uniref:hypothetical protein n=1 Tax=Catalinimonas locisalis TaxID=3133978 RepID=UPI00310164BC
MQEEKDFISNQVEDFWFPLDNAAKIFPATLNEEYTAVFRMAAVLKERVRIKPLFEALNALEDRFPYYKVRLKKGLFWYYLETIHLPFSVEVDDQGFCRSFQSSDLLNRILVRNNTISVEFSHILTDGSGGLMFLKSILMTYFEKCGTHISDEVEYARPKEAVKEEEFEDAYQRYFRKDSPLVSKIPPAFHLPYSLKKKPRFETQITILPLKEVLKAVKEKSYSITVYLVSVYLMVLQQIFEKLDETEKRKSHKILRINVPINLRAIYPSKTMRNFSLFVRPEIDLRMGQYTFDEILKKVHHFIQLKADKKQVNQVISRNVGGEKRLEVRSLPLFLKNMFLNLKHNSLGPALYSGVITNLGKVDFSAEVNPYIDYLIFTAPPPPKTLKVSCGIIGFDDKLVLSFGNISTSMELENRFFGFLADQGVSSQIVKPFSME